MLRVDNLYVQYGNVQALKDISLSVERGELVALIGSNGAGKTTTLRAISGLVKASRGSIEFQKRRIDGLRPYKILERGVVHIPERRELFSEMTVMENLEMGAYRAKSGQTFDEKLSYITELFPVLTQRQNQLAGTLSGGEQQMLAIGRGLMANPSILILDEPSLGLAPIMVNMLGEVMKHLHQRGMTILLVEQNAYMALNLADRGYVFQTGCIVLDGPGKQLLSNQAVKKAYLGM